MKLTTIYGTEVEINPSEAKVSDGVNADSVRIVAGDIDDFFIGDITAVRDALETARAQVAAEEKKPAVKKPAAKKPASPRKKPSARKKSETAKK